MHWEKLGLLFAPSDIHEKLRSHAANPLAVPLNGDLFRVFYSGRDRLNRSSVGYVDIDMSSCRVVYIHDAPVFEYGPHGSFYSHGVSIGNCYSVGDKTYMLFMGWQVPDQGHWRGDIGRLVVGPDEKLTLDGNGPFLATDAEDPISLSYPWVERTSGGNFLMWYGSTLAWDAGNGEMSHVLKYATSADGENWIRKGQAVPYILGTAQAFSRPTVLIGPDGLHEMWFSYRSGTGQTYRIGYATSRDGIGWSLDLKNSGIDVSSTGWDAQMIEYPFVFSHNGRTYMLYNGNEYGRTGFGLAMLRR